MYIRHKVIKGHTYYYLVEGRRDGAKVKQRVIKYLGKHPRTLSHAAGFAPIIRKDAKEMFTRLFYRLGSASVSFDIPFSDSGHYGQTIIRTKAVRFRDPASGLTMGHELGHVIDISLRERNALNSGSPEFVVFRDELERLTDYLWSSQTSASKARLEQLQRWQEKTSLSSALKVTLRRQIAQLEEFYAGYAYKDHELFGNLVALNLIEPRKAKQLAPKATRWLKDLLWKQTDIRDALIVAGAFELGTTRQSATLDPSQKSA